jgi:subtilisin family serine protease
MRNFVVLRNLRARQTGEPFGEWHGGEVDISARPASIAELRVNVETNPSREGFRDLMRDPEVVSVAPLMPLALIRPFESQASTVGDASWGITAVRADKSSFTGRGVTVAVLDTGIDSAHPAFAGVEFIMRDFTGPGDGRDVDGHGTHCSGTVFGRDVDGVRIGVARGVRRALIGKVLADNGSGSSEALFSGMTWAAENGAQVISMSLGFDFPGLVAKLTADNWPADLATSSALEAYRANLRMFDSLMRILQAREAFGSGTVVVAASGNESRRDVRPDYEIAASLPAAAEGVISVGAAAPGQNGFRIGSFSNTFPQLAAPGVDIFSAHIGGGLKALSGTSMAAPHVAGVAALWWEALASRGFGGVSARAVTARLLATARPDVFVPDVDQPDCGEGLVTAP